MIYIEREDEQKKQLCKTQRKNPSSFVNFFCDIRKISQLRNVEGDFFFILLMFFCLLMRQQNSNNNNSATRAIAILLYSTLLWEFVTNLQDTCVRKRQQVFYVSIKRRSD